MNETTPLRVTSRMREFGETIFAEMSALAVATASVEPTGIVDLLTTTLPGRSIGAISRATPSTIDRSAAPLSVSGRGATPSPSTSRSGHE